MWITHPSIFSLGCQEYYFKKDVVQQESVKVYWHIGPIPIVIPLKLFLDLLRDPGIPTRVN